MFIMQTCPYCEFVEKQVEGDPRFEVIDISKHVRNLKQFLDLRDNCSAFDPAKKNRRCGHSLLCTGGWHRDPLIKRCRPGADA